MMETGYICGQPEETSQDENPDYYLSRFEIGGLLSDNFKVYSFSMGEEMLPVKKYLSSKLIKLWSSSLSRPINDPLVIEDSGKCPYDRNLQAMLVQERNTGDITGIFLFETIDTELHNSGLYLNICLIEEKYQEVGIISKLIDGVINKDRLNFVVLQTQNEHMVQTLRKFCPKGHLFPIDGEPTPAVLDIVKPFVKNPEKFDYIKLVDKNTYSNGNPLYGDRKERHSSHADIREFFAKNVDFQQGDSVLIVGILNKSMFVGTV